MVDNAIRSKFSDPTLDWTPPLQSNELADNSQNVFDNFAAYYPENGSYPGNYAYQNENNWSSNGNSGIFSNTPNNNTVFGNTNGVNSATNKSIYDMTDKEFEDYKERTSEINNYQQTMNNKASGVDLASSLSKVKTLLENDKLKEAKALLTKIKDSGDISQFELQYEAMHGKSLTKDIMDNADNTTGKVAKTAGCAAAGAVMGTPFGGPIGAAVGGIIGGIVGGVKQFAYDDQTSENELLKVLTSPPKE